MRAAILTLPVCLMPLLAHTQALPLTVGDMADACGTITAEDGEITPENAVAVGACFGAIRGVVQVMQANCRSIGAGQRPAVALTVGEIPTPGEAITAFEDWAEANRDEADAPAEYGMIVSLTRAFPCRAALPDVTQPPGEDGQEQEPASE